MQSARATFHQCMGRWRGRGLQDGVWRNGTSSTDILTVKRSSVISRESPSYFGVTVYRLNFVKSAPTRSVRFNAQRRKLFPMAVVSALMERFADSLLPGFFAAYSASPRCFFCFPNHMGRRAYPCSRKRQGVRWPDMLAELGLAAVAGGVKTQATRRDKRRKALSFRSQPARKAGWTSFGRDTPDRLVVSSTSYAPEEPLLRAAHTSGR